MKTPSWFNYQILINDNRLEFILGQTVLSWKGLAISVYKSILTNKKSQPG